jgi:hypothetical protein
MTYNKWSEDTGIYQLDLFLTAGSGSAFYVDADPNLAFPVKVQFHFT